MVWPKREFWRTIFGPPIQRKRNRELTLPPWLRANRFLEMMPYTSHECGRGWLRSVIRNVRPCRRKRVGPEGPRHQAPAHERKGTASLRKSARYMCSPEASLGKGPRHVFVIQL